MNVVAAAPPSAPVPTLYLIDASMYVFRAWHSMPGAFFDVDGHPVNAVHGFARFRWVFAKGRAPGPFFPAFDMAVPPSSGKASFPPSKANATPRKSKCTPRFDYVPESAAR